MWGKNTLEVRVTQLERNKKGPLGEAPFIKVYSSNG
jgi:hypothetical protein